MKLGRVLAATMVTLMLAALIAPPAFAAEQKTVLTFSIKEARASLWQIHYPQSTFVSEKYGPCVAADDERYGCDRTRYNQEPDTCPENVALGRTKEAPETPKAEELTDPVDDDGGVTREKWPPQPSPVTVIHGLASGHLAAIPEAGGFASMYYVDSSGRRETEAHVESDASVGNRSDYEERCAVVDAFSETGHYPGPFNAHMLSRASEAPSVYSMAAFSTAETADDRLQAVAPQPPGASKQSIAIVKLWEEKGLVHGIVTSTVRGVNIADGAIVIDAIRSVISFTSDGTEKGLKALAQSSALGVRIGDMEIASLKAGQIVDLGEKGFLGVIRPVVQVTNGGHNITIRAPGAFLAAHTNLDTLPIPEEYLTNYGFIDGEEALMEALKPVRDGACMRLAPTGVPCINTLGGQLKADQVIYIASTILDAGVGRVQAFDFLPSFPVLPPLPPLAPGLAPPTFGPGTTPPLIGPGQQPVALPRLEVRELAGSPWPLISILTFTAFGFVGIMGRWSMRYAWARSLSRYPPFPAFGWAYRAFLKG